MKLRKPDDAWRCDRPTCGHEWDDHNHENPDSPTFSPAEDCCTVRGCDCPIFLPENP